MSIIYDTAEISAPASEVGTYRRFSATTPDGRVLQYATNRSGSGLFRWDNLSCTWVQLQGTAYYQSDGRRSPRIHTEAAARRFLDNVLSIFA